MMTTQQVLYMIGGVGDTSYANNSLLAKKMMLKTKPIVEETMKRVYSDIIIIDLPNNNNNNNDKYKCLKVADLGCSSGPNTLQLLSHIINTILDEANLSILPPPVFQFFLNDLFGNDFNTLFTSLPQFYQTLEQEDNNKNKFGSSCFINATPGTFYNRLFPNTSMHFFHSSYALHWLSQAPRDLVIKDNIYLTSTSSPAMHKAYLEQFQFDFKSFLKFRSEELVPGGGMVLIMIGREGTSELRTSWGFIGMSLYDMVLENLIEEVKLESFNLPLYDPTREEARQVIEEEGSFIVNRLESITIGWDGNINEDVVAGELLDENMRGEFVVKYHRAVFEPLLKAHFGEGIMDELFQRFKNKIVQKMMEVERLEYPALVISLIKKKMNECLKRI